MADVVSLGLAFPASDLALTPRFRELGEPVSLFGEDLYERRARLREVMFLPRTARAVKLRLRQLQEPIFIFGEDPVAQRERLRGIMGELHRHWSRVALVAMKTADPQLLQVIGSMTDRAFRLRVFRFFLAQDEDQIG